jgi:hypothetical protein
VLTTKEAGMLNASDEGHLTLAANQGRVIIIIRLTIPFSSLVTERTTNYLLELPQKKFPF